MSATIFLAVCILGCDLLLYFLFQWTYGEKRRGLARRSRSNRAYGNSQRSQPLEYVPRQPRPVVPIRRPNGMELALSRFENMRRTLQEERRAHRGIAASYASAKR